ncbi:hypothetical protein [Trichocoleus sp. AS-A1]|uniref:hypothetical protein n=1 Tax=Trichocoleus sp. AS-A1 TaxID=2933921 RepID=UPI0032989345
MNYSVLLEIGFIRWQGCGANYNRYDVKDSCSAKFLFHDHLFSSIAIINSSPR